jgi:two-component sensor histidine kinase
VNGKTISTNLQKAVPCGLIINEIITNSIKHAFVRGTSAEIELNLHQDGAQVVMDIADNGVGLPATSALSSDSVGMKLIMILTKQLDGQLNMLPGEGTRYVLKFVP